MSYFFFMAHSGWRYLILLAGLATVVYGLYGAVTNRAYDKPMRVTSSVFAGTMHAQILIGIAMLFAGQFNPQSGLHIVMMLFAAACAQIPVSVMRRRPVEQRTYAPHAVFAAASLAMIVLGIVSLPSSGGRLLSVIT